MQRKPDSVEWILGAIIVAAVIFVWVSSNSNNREVVIIRTDQILNETGYAVEAESIFRAERSKLEAELIKKKKDYDRDIAERRADYEANPSPEKEQTLQVMQQNMQSQMMQHNKAKQERLQRLRSQMKKDFYNELGPLILKLAAEKDFGIVLDQSSLGEGVVYIDSVTDITDLVVNEFRIQSVDGAIESPPTSIPGAP